ncbi:MAG: hypothetical protein ACOCWT_01445 [Desulfohalobiaceae bacterium]
MKGYFFLLCILCAGMLFKSVWGLFIQIHPLVTLSQLGDIILIPLCTVACYGLAFKKVIWDLPKWTLVRILTLALGVYSVIVYGFGERYGIPTIGDPGLMTVALIFLPYLLSAIPVILYESALKKGFDRNG